MKASHTGMLGYYYGAQLPMCMGTCRHYFRNTVLNKGVDRAAQEIRFRACVAVGMTPERVTRKQRCKGNKNNHGRMPKIPASASMSCVLYLSSQPAVCCVLCNLTHSRSLPKPP